MNNNVSDINRNNNTVDYDLHGIVGIRLLNPGSGNVKAADSQLGTFRSLLTREPDIIIEFVDSLSTNEPLNYLGSGEFAFTKDAFFINGDEQKGISLQIPFDQIGKQCRIVCKKPIFPVSLLMNIVNLTALANGTLPLHASAFSYEGLGYLITGWSGGGKTGSLLSYLAQGASYVSSEYVFISPDGNKMFGIPQPVRLRDWHLQTLPQFSESIKPGEKRHLRAIKFLQFFISFFTKELFSKLFPGSISSKIAKFLQRQLYVDVSPYELFGKECVNLSSSVDKVFITYSYANPEIVIQKTEFRDAARRINNLHQYEFSKFMKYYAAFLFAFPDLRNEFLENANNLQLEQLKQFLADKDIYSIYHPHPVSLPGLFKAMNVIGKA
jgi:hypothetical protein